MCMIYDICLFGIPDIGNIYKLEVAYFPHPYALKICLDFLDIATIFFSILINVMKNDVNKHFTK